MAKTPYPARWQKNQQLDDSNDSWLGEDSFSKENLKDLCRSIQLKGSVQQVILSKNLDFVACGWVEDDKRAEDVVRQISESWDGGVHSSQLQYYQIGDEDVASLLYTRMVGGYLLTLVARQDTSFQVIRSQSDRLFAEITRKPIDRKPEPASNYRTISPKTENEDKTRRTYALILWPIEPLPSSLQKFVTKTINQISGEKGCDLKNLLVQEDRLQILVELPAGRPTSWFVKLVKDGVKDEIQNHFGISLEFWASGFYASQADRLLTETELSLLNRRE